MNQPSRLASAMLCLPGLLLESAIRLRNGCYSCGMLSRVRLPAPVISIGNLTLGGTGKTPLVIFTAAILNELGASLALLSRGYGRNNMHETHVLAPGNEIPSPAKNLGDEPALIRLHSPHMWLGISANRVEAGRRILARRPGIVFLLDDGFQHRRLQRDLDIVVLDRSQPLIHNRVMPRGTLREPLGGLKRADVVVLNGGRSDEGASQVEVLIRNLNPRAMVLHCHQEIDCVVPFQTWRQKRGAGEPRAPVSDAFLVAAIGNPGRFIRDVTEFGARVRGSKFYRDHKKLEIKDWHRCWQEAQAAGAEAVITTEKDAVKIAYQPGFPLLVAVQSTNLLERSAFKQVLRRTLEEYA